MSTLRERLEKAEATERDELIAAAAKAHDLAMAKPRMSEEEYAAQLQFASVLDRWGRWALAKADGNLRDVLVAFAGVVVNACCRDEEWRTGWNRILWHVTGEQTAPLLLMLRPPEGEEEYQWDE